MRIAVPVSGGKFSAHFGQSTAFWICDAQPGSEAAVEGREFQLPEGGCAVIPGILAQAGVTLVIAGGMGAGAVTNLTRCGIMAITGASGDTPQQIVQEYLAGRLNPTGELCRHHENHAHDHDHAHGHNGACHGHGRD